jgi:hypothetical protein
MRINKSLLLGATLVCCCPFIGKTQSLLGITDSIQSATQPLPPLESTWKDTKLINMQTTKTVSPGVMVFRVQHRFGNMGVQSNGGIHTLYGFDVVTDIYLGFEFGILNNLQVSVGRSKDNELLDAGFKYRPLTQKSKGMPISLALYGDAAITPMLSSVFYSGADSSWIKNSNVSDRISYVGELLIDRKFGRVGSLELVAGFSHRNYVLALTNPGNNNARDSNNIAYVGAAGRICLSKHASLVFDYYYYTGSSLTFSPYRTNNTLLPYYNCFSVGYEIETGGHVFEINLSNGAYMNENNIIPTTIDSWTKGGFKLGFSISRAFNI